MLPDVRPSIKFLSVTNHYRHAQDSRWIELFRGRRKRAMSDRVSATIRSRVNICISVAVHLSPCNRFALYSTYRRTRRRARGICPCPSFTNRGRYAITTPEREYSSVVVMRAMQGKFDPLSFFLPPTSRFPLSFTHGRYTTFPIFWVWRPSWGMFWTKRVASVRSIDLIRELLVTVLMKRFVFYSRDR